MIRSAESTSSMVDRVVLRSTIGVSLLFLAWSVQSTLGDVRTGPAPPSADWVIRIAGTDSASGGEAGLSDLVVDGRRLRFNEAQTTGQWLPVSNGSRLFHPSGTGPATVAFRASEFKLVMTASPQSSDIVVERNGTPIERVDLRRDQWQEVPLELPPRQQRGWIFWPALVVLSMLAGALAWRRAPGFAESWALVHLTTLGALVWLTQPIGTNNDTLGYLEGVRGLYEGQPDYFPPGTSIVIAAGKLVPGLELGNAVTLLQALMFVIAGIWAFRLLRREVSEPAALAITLLVGSSAVWLTTPRAVLSEAVAVFAAMGSLYFLVTSAERDKPLRSALGGMLGGLAGLARVIPIAGIVPAAAVYLWFRRPARTRLVSTSFALGLALTLILPMAWFGLRSGHFGLATSSSGHLYNRVVYSQHLLAEDGPATRRLRTYLGARDPWYAQHYNVKQWLEDHGLSPDEANQLMRDVSREAIRAHPLRFAGFSVVSGLQLTMMNFRFYPYAEATKPDPSVENAPLLGVSAESLKWRRTLENIQDALWPIVALLSLLALPILILSSHERPILLAFALIGFGQIAGASVGEGLFDRYMAPVQPFLLLATGGAVIAILRSAVLAPWLRALMPWPVSRALTMPDEDARRITIPPGILSLAFLAGLQAIWFAFAPAGVLNRAVAFLLAAASLGLLLVWRNRPAQLSTALIRIGAVIAANLLWTAAVVPTPYAARLLLVGVLVSYVGLAFYLGLLSTGKLRGHIAGTIALLVPVGAVVAEAFFQRKLESTGNPTGIATSVPAPPPGQDGFYAPDTRALSVYPDDPRNYFARLDSSQFGVSYRFNQYGCRGADVSPTPEARTVRILALGDSYTLGAGVHENDAWPARLQALLNNAGETAKYEVMNCGVTGFSTPDALTMYERVAAAYRPDVVIAMVVPGDESRSVDDVPYPRTEYFERKSHLFYGWRLVRSLWGASRGEQRNWDAIVHTLRELERKVTSQRAALAVVTMHRGILDDDRRLDAILSAELKLDQLHLADDLSVLQESDFAAHPQVDAHPSPAVHQLVAERLVRHLRQRALVPARAPTR